MKSPRPPLVAFIALFLSGIAGVLNQVIWQRALKIFLGGSETISAMIVVLVFMLGLGLGAGLTARRAARLAHPFRAFGLVEAILFAVNIVIALLLAADLSESIYAAQRLTLSLGIPLRVVYGLASLTILLVPTVLMGATLPLASEACQRQFGATDRMLITAIFFVNTIGAVAGAALSSFYLLPYHGQFQALIVAAGMNMVAAIIVLTSARRVSPAPAASTDPTPATDSSARGITHEMWFGLVLGFLSLGFEMILFRLMALSHGSLPYTFATTLCCFLLFWSIGVFVARHFARYERVVFVVTALTLAVIPPLYRWGRFDVDLPLWAAGIIFFLPCIGFGILYGLLVARSARQWGEDVGRFYALNTVGSCLGILFFTLVGYELPQHYTVWLVAGCMLWLAGLLRNEGGAVHSRKRTALLVTAIVATFSVAVFDGMRRQHTVADQLVSFWGRDGVVEIDRKKADVLIDGLWHSRLSGGKAHIGRAYTWMMATAGVLACDEDPKEVLVVGNCIGITATTLAKQPNVSVDAYEIVQTLKDVLKAFPDGTLNIETNPRVTIHWTDGRGGLALNEKTYDLIVSAPQQLKQAGGSMLLSQEYLTLVRRRLNPGGVAVLYSYEGVPAQYELIRRTVADQFKFTATWLGGLLTVASDSPIDFSETTMAARLQRPGGLYAEIREHDEWRVERGHPPLAELVDEPIPAPKLGPDAYYITDDHPLAEYPTAATRLVRNVIAPREDQ